MVIIAGTHEEQPDSELLSESSFKANDTSATEWNVQMRQGKKCGYWSHHNITVNDENELFCLIQV